MDDGLVLKLVRVIESLAPVAEVARDNKDGLFIFEEGQEELSVLVVLVVWDLADHEWDHLHLCLPRILEALLNVGQMELEAMFIFFEPKLDLLDVYITP